MASLTFVNAYAVNTATTPAGKELNSIDFNPAALGTAVISDGSGGVNFSGNDVVVRLTINNTDYFGWISRPIKSGGQVKGFYFWRDASFGDLNAATTDSNRDTDGNDLDNSGFVLVVDQAWFNAIATTGGLKNVGSSSDRVDSALNSVLPVNSAPVGVNDGATVLEDAASVSGNVLTNDTDADSNPLVVSAFSIAGQAGPFTLGTPYAIAGVGTFTLTAAGGYTFVPAAQYTGAVPQITYTLSDGNGGSSTARLSLGVTAVNDAPSGSDSTLTVLEGGQYAFSLTDFGFSDANDSPANALLSVKITTLPAAGALTLNGAAVVAGDFISAANLPLLRYTPVAGAFGNSYASFTFQVRDDGGTANAGVDLDASPNTLTFNVTNVNSAPAAATDSATAVEAGGVGNATAGTNPSATAAAGLLANDSDPDGAITAGTSHTVSSASSAVTANTSVGLNTAIVGQYGTLTLSSDGSYSYAVAQSNSAVQALRTSSNTLTDSFSYVITDAGGLSATSTLTLTIQGANDAPAAVDDRNIAKESTTPAPAVTGFGAAANLLTNDTDSDGGETKLVTAITHSSSVTAADVVVNVSSSKLVFNGDNGFASVRSGFEFYVKLAADGVTTTYRGMYYFDGLTYGLVGVASSPTSDGAGGTLIQLSNTPTHYANGSGGYVSLGGSLASFLTTNSQVLFTNSNNATEQAGRNDKTAIVTATEPVPATTDLSRFSNLTGSIAAGMSVSGPSVPVDTRVSAVTYTGGRVTKLTLDKELSSTAGGDYTFDSTLTVGTSYTAAHGSLQLNANGSYTYTPTTDNAALAAGQPAVEKFNYTMQDTAGATSTASLYITVYGSGPSDPVANADTADGVSAAVEAGTAAGSTASGNVRTNDTDPQGDTLTITLAGTSSAASAITAGSTSASNGLSITGTYGTLVVGADGSYVYTPDDGNGTVNALRTSSETLTDRFVYRVSDGTNFSESSLTVTIKGANDAPTATADTALALEAGGTGNGTSGINPGGNLLTNDSDVDGGDTRAVSAFSHATGGAGLLGGAALSGTHGSLTLTAAGVYSYSVNNSSATVQGLQAGATLTETYQYTIADAAGATASSTLTITISGVNDAPVNTVPGAAYTVNEASTGNALAGLAVADADSTTVTTKLTVVRGTVAVGTLGSATISAGASGTATFTLSGSPADVASALGTITYTPQDGFNGTDTLTLLSTDAEGLVDTDAVGITVSPDARALTVTGTTVNEASAYALFTVGGASGQRVQLALSDVSTTVRSDYTGVLEYYDGANWQPYASGAWVSMPGATMLVRTAVLPDSASEGAEVLRLSAVNRASVAATGDTTLVDDGTGLTYDGTVTGGAANSANTNLDDDRPLSVNNIAVNEASTHAVFTVSGTTGQVMTLALVAGSATAGTDHGNALEVWDGAAWQPYGASATFTSGTLLVRTTITNDGTFEGPETFALRATNAGGGASTGTATILDDGTGLKYDGNVSGGGTPVTTNTGLDNDLSVAVVGAGPVNEASAYAMFTVTASQGAALTLALSQTGTTVATTAGFTMAFSTDGGATWTSYSASSTPVVPGVIGGGTGTVYVRVDIATESDVLQEGAETFSLTATLGADGAAPLSSAAQVAIVDDGTGLRYDGTLTGGAPTSDNTGLDNDVAAGGLTLTGTSLTTSETGTSASFTVKLNSQPTADVTVTLSGLDNTEGSLSATTLTFTSGNWNTAQTVTVTGVDDTLDDGDIAYTLTATTSSTDANYTGANARTGTVSVTNTDDDAAPTLSIDDVTVGEGAGTATFTVTRSGASGGTTTVDYATASGSAAAGSDFTAASGTLSFAPGQTSKTITVAITEDSAVEGSEGFTVGLSNIADASSGAESISDSSGAGTITDNDSAGLTLTGGPLTTSETGTSAPFSLVLTSQPTGDVTVTLSGLDNTEGSLSATTLTFASGNWNTAQTVTVTGVDDPLIDGTQAYTLSATTSSSDGNYGGANAHSASVAVRNTDNDRAGLTLTGGPLTTRETGTSAPFSLVLTSQPTGDVTVTLSGLDNTEGSLSATTLTFTSGNWNTAQTVTVTGVDDPLIDGTQAYTLSATTSSSDGNYGGANAHSASVAVSNTDDDVQRVTAITPGAAVPEGQPLGFTVTLSAASTRTETYAFSLGGAAGTADWTELLATNGVSIDLASGLVSIPPGVTSFTFTVVTRDDLLVEAARESLTLTLGGAQGSSGILDNDTRPAPPVIVDVTETPTDPTPADLLTGDTTQVLRVLGTPGLPVLLYTRDGQQISPAGYSVTETAPGVFTLDAQGINLNVGDYVVRQVDAGGNESPDSNQFTVDSTPELEENTQARVIIPGQGLSGRFEVIDQNRVNLTPFQSSRPPSLWYDSDGERALFGLQGGSAAGAQVSLRLANGSTLEVNSITGAYLYKPSSDAILDVFPVTVRDPGGKGGNLALSFEVRDLLDRDGVPAATEEQLATRLTGTADNNGDGVSDANQSAVTTMAWTRKDHLSYALQGQIEQVPSTSVVTVVANESLEGSQVSPIAQLINFDVLKVDRDGHGGLPTTNLGSTLSMPWDALAFSIEPLQSLGLIDVDASRPGLQQRVTIDISRSGILDGDFQAYYKWISADTILAAVQAGVPLITFDNVALVSPNQAGWYDFTQRTPGGDGARFVSSNGKITGIDIILTDNVFGDIDFTPGRLTDPGMPVARPDALPPVITGPSGGAGAPSSLKNIPENTRSVFRFTADEPVGWSLEGGVDAPLFQLDADGNLSFAAAPNYEAPTDAGRDNRYDLVIKAVDGSGNAATQRVTVQVTDVPEPVPMYRADLRTGDRLLTLDLAGAQNTARAEGGSSGLEFWVMPEPTKFLVPLVAWRNLLTGDLFYAPRNAELPYACYVPIDAGPLGYVPQAGQGAFDLHLWMDARGITQIVSRDTALQMGLAGKGYADLGALFGSAAQVDGTPMVGLVGIETLSGG
jgi:VCBS repeat-containing protein